MRWRAATLLMTPCGCLLVNPAYDDAGTASEVGSSSAPTTGAGATTGEASAGETTGTADPTTGAAPTSGEASTGDLSTGTGGSGSSGAPDPVCLAKERLQLAAVAWDTGVVPPTMPQPCPWGGVECSALNFGKTEYFRLVNDVEKGRSAALLAFPRGAIESDLAAAGFTLADVVAFRLALVVWEPTGAPGSPLSLGVSLLGAADAAWYEGDKTSTPAQLNDSSFLCKRIEMQGCVPWTAADGPLGDVQPLGELVVTPEEVMSSDEDDDPGQYHARIVSQALPAGPLHALWPSADPTFVVTVTSDRAIQGPEVGIKFKEAPWSDPAVQVDVCTQWQ